MVQTAEQEQAPLARAIAIRFRGDTLDWLRSEAAQNERSIGAEVRIQVERARFRAAAEEDVEQTTST